jgi:hypothetical protein
MATHFKILHDSFPLYNFFKMCNPLNIGLLNLWQGASMGGFCWSDGWLVCWLLEKSVQIWSTRFMQFILLVSHWSESILLIPQAPVFIVYTAWLTVQVYKDW